MNDDTPVKHIQIIQNACNTKLYCIVTTHDTQKISNFYTQQIILSQTSSSAHIPSYQMDIEDCFLGHNVATAEHKTDDSPSSSMKIRLYKHIPPLTHTSSWHSAEVNTGICLHGMVLN
jgi:hypothetical protein